MVYLCCVSVAAVAAVADLAMSYYAPTRPEHRDERRVACWRNSAKTAAQVRRVVWLGAHHTEWQRRPDEMV